MLKLISTVWLRILWLKLYIKDAKGERDAFLFCFLDFTTLFWFINHSQDIWIFLKTFALRQLLNTVYDLILFLIYIGLSKKQIFAHLSHLF